MPSKTRRGHVVPVGWMCVADYGTRRQGPWGIGVACDIVRRIAARFELGACPIISSSRRLFGTVTKISPSIAAESQEPGREDHDPG